MTENRTESYKPNIFIGLALDPIHVGSGSSHLGRVDNAIVRDPVTRIPKIPGSSLAGVYRAYTAMAKDRYPRCAGQGQNEAEGKDHCGQGDCPVCTVFGFAKRSGGGFAGLAAFTDAQVLLFPVATREGPFWITCPSGLRWAGCDESQLGEITGDTVYILKNGVDTSPLNLGWLLLKRDNSKSITLPNGTTIPPYIQSHWGILTDKLFSHVVNSNLEVRTSVAIDPSTGAAQEGALFTYEALPRATVLCWQIICRNPKHFKIGNQAVEAVSDYDSVQQVAKEAHPYLEHLGIGGMGTRGMGRLKVLDKQEAQQ